MCDFRAWLLPLDPSLNTASKGIHIDFAFQLNFVTFLQQRKVIEKQDAHVFGLKQKGNPKVNS